MRVAATTAATRVQEMADVGQTVEAAEQTAASTPRSLRGTAAPEGRILLTDDAMIHTDRAWHEAEVGVRQPLVRAGLTPFMPPGPADYSVGFESGAPFWSRFAAHAVQAGIRDPRCPRIVQPGDGAHWIWDDGAASCGGAGTAEQLAAAERCGPGRRDPRNGRLPVSRTRLHDPTDGARRRWPRCARHRSGRRDPLWATDTPGTAA